MPKKIYIGDDEKNIVLYVEDYAGNGSVTNKDKTVTSVKDVKNGDTLAINVTDGKIISKVIGE